MQSPRTACVRERSVPGIEWWASLHAAGLPHCCCLCGRSSKLTTSRRCGMSLCERSVMVVGAAAGHEQLRPDLFGGCAGCSDDVVECCCVRDEYICRARATMGSTPGPANLRATAGFQSWLTSAVQRQLHDRRVCSAVLITRHNCKSAVGRHSCVVQIISFSVTARHQPVALPACRAPGALRMTASRSPLPRQRIHCHTSQQGVLTRTKGAAPPPQVLFMPISSCLLECAAA